MVKIMWNIKEIIMFKKGFTLAEVLITLMIIGIVAALTIPSVISNYQQQEFKTGLKKAVSVLNEAIQTNIAQEGETPYENYDLFSYLKRHMSIMKSGALPSDLYGGLNQYFYTTDGMRFEFGAAGEPFQNITLHESGLKPGLFADGFYHDRWGNILTDTNHSTLYSHECGSYGLGDNKNNTKNPPCFIMVDVNGDKKPNPKYIENKSEYSSRGYDLLYDFPAVSDKKLSDIFTIMITDEKAIPFGVVAQRAMYSSK